MIDCTLWITIAFIFFFIVGTVNIRNVIVNYRNYKFYAVGRNVMSAVFMITCMICIIVKMLWR